ncbi:MAG: DUF559 domain-containing protein [Novosphingobium sp.]|nr:DUF559 domain-containing protein [Novosphingobium sp.]
MSERKTLKLRDTASSGGKGWGISAARLDKLQDYAREMRRNPTESEQRLWTRLANGQLGGFKFRRQAVVGSAIVDFACPARWLCVEIDGETHVNPEVDALRDRKLTDVGLRVLRFTNRQVMEELDGVCEAILLELQKPFDRRTAARNAATPHPSIPSPSGEGPGMGTGDDDASLPDLQEN